MPTKTCYGSIRSAAQIGLRLELGSPAPDAHRSGSGCDEAHGHCDGAERRRRDLTKRSRPTGSAELQGRGTRPLRASNIQCQDCVTSFRTTRALSLDTMRKHSAVLAMPRKASNMHAVRGLIMAQRDGADRPDLECVPRSPLGVLLIVLVSPLPLPGSGPGLATLPARIMISL